MKIRMLETTLGSDDGYHIHEYRQGHEYDMSGSAGARDLAQVFVHVMRVAVGAESAQVPHPERTGHELMPEPTTHPEIGTPPGPPRPSRRRKG